MRKTRHSLTNMVAILATFLLLVSCTTPYVAASQSLRSARGPYELEVLVDGVAARSFAHGGETHVLGHAGQRYVLRVHNHSGRRVEAVVTVDGLSVMDGKPGDYAHQRGYLVPAHSQVDIEGFRLSTHEAAAFRFGAIADSYAAKTGQARNIGVIGVAIFDERQPRIAARPRYRSHSAGRSAGDSFGRPADKSAGAPAGSERRGAPRADANLGSAEGEAQAAPAPAARPSDALAQEDAAPRASRADAAPRAEMPRQRPGLGTEFGEAVSSAIREVPFSRARPHTPKLVLGVRYNDRDGLLALGIDVDGLTSDLALRQSADPFPRSERRYAQPPMGWQR